MECNACGKVFDVTPSITGAWLITLSNNPDATTYLVAAEVPMCIDPTCTHDLVDTRIETVSTESGAVIRIEHSERPYLN